MWHRTDTGIAFVRDNSRRNFISVNLGSFSRCHCVRWVGWRVKYWLSATVFHLQTGQMVCNNIDINEKRPWEIPMKLREKLNSPWETRERQREAAIEWNIQFGWSGPYSKNASHSMQVKLVRKIRRRFCGNEQKRASTLPNVLSAIINYYSCKQINIPWASWYAACFRVFHTQHLRLCAAHAVRDNIAHLKTRVFNDNLLCMVIPGNSDPYIKRNLIKHNKNLGILN